MFNNISKIDYNKKICLAIMFQLLFCFVIDIKFNSFLFIGAIIVDILIIISVFIFCKDSQLIACTIIASFTLTYLSENMGFPSEVKYIQDVFVLIMAVKLCIYSFRKKFKIYNLYFIFILFILFSIFSCMLNKENIISYFKTLYFDYLRYFIIGAFIINSEISEEKIIKYIKILWYVLLAQIPLVVFQYFKTLNNWVAKNPGDIRQDYLSGIIGGRGTTELGLLITIGLSILFLLYLFKRVRLMYFVVCSILLVTISILAEVKFILVLLPVTFFSVVLIRFNFKSISLFILTMIMLIIGGIQLTKIYPEFNNFFNVQSIQKYSQDSYAASGIGRTNSFIISNSVLSNSYENIIWGYGMGNSDAISKKYKFSAFNVSQYMIECGYSGIILIYGLYAYMIIISFRLTKLGYNELARTLGYAGIIIMEVIIVSTFYNRSMVKINFAVFSWMAIGLIYRYYCISKEKNKLNKL